MASTWKVQVRFRLRENPWAEPEQWRPIMTNVEGALASQDTIPGGKLTHVVVGFAGNTVVIDGVVLRHESETVNPLEGTRRIIEVVMAAAEQEGLSGTGYLEAIHFEPADAVPEMGTEVE
jgi:hypothetical protein